MTKRKQKEQAQKILATLLMGMNCVNTLAPIGLLANTQVQTTSVNIAQTSTEKTYDYPVLTRAADYVDSLMFATAEAREVQGPISGETIIGETVSVTGTGQSLVAEDCIVGSGGTLTIAPNGYNGGIAISCIIKDGGVVQSLVNGMFQRIQTTGCVFENASINMNGSSLQDTLSFNGVQTVGGTATSTTINSGGTQNIFGEYGSSTSATINNGGTQNISGKNTYGLNATIKSGGVQNIGSGGKGTSASIDGGVQNVSSGGTATSAAINTNGMQNVSSGGIANNTSINDGGIQNVESGGKVISTTINNGGTQQLSGGAVIGSNGVVINGGEQHIYGAVVTSGTNAKITFGANGGTQVLHEGGQYSFTNLSGGTQTVCSGGIGKIDMLENGGVQNVENGGSGSIRVLSGGTQNVAAGAQVDIIQQMFGGIQNINGGSATISGMYTNQNYGTQNINGGSGYWVSVGDINKQSLQNIINGIGRADDIGLHGEQKVSGGSGIAGMISSGGLQTVVGGSGIVTEIHNGGTQNVSAGIGTVDHLYGSSGGNAMPPGSGGQQNIYGGVGSAATVNSGGIQTVYDGSAYAGFIEYAGIQDIKGGTGYIELLEGGNLLNHYKAQQLVSAGVGIVEKMERGQAEQVITGGTGIVKTLGKVNDDGHPKQIVSGGSGVAVNIIRGGVQEVYEGAEYAYAETVSGYIEGVTYHGGTQMVYGAEGGANVLDGGLQIVSKAAGATDAKGHANSIENGGLQHIQDGSGTVIVIESGEQKVEKGTGSAGLIETGGVQTVLTDGVGTANTVNGGAQNISGGSGDAKYLLNLGAQNIDDQGIGSVESILSGGVQNISAGGKGSVTSGVYGGGTQNVEAGGASTSAIIAGGEQIVAGTVTDTVINAGTQVLVGGSSLNTILNNGVIDFQDNTTLVKDLTVNGGEVRLGGGGSVVPIGTGDYHISGTLQMNGGVIDMVKKADGSIPGSFETLTVEKANGDQTFFRMDTNLAAGQSDQVIIQNSDNIGDKKGIIQINNMGDITENGNLKQLLVTDESKTIKFAGAFYNPGGLWEVKPTVENGLALSEDEKEWYLTGLVKKVNNDTQVLLHTNDNSYAMWRNTNDSMRKHFGDLRQGGLNSDGMWARTLQGKFGGNGFDSSYSMYQLGYDKADNAKSIYGIAAEYGTGSASYANGSGKDKLTTMSMYGIWYGDNGTYTNLIGRFGMLDSDISTYGDNPDKASNNSHAYSLSAEYGKTIELKPGVFIEPQAQVTVGRLSGSDYITDRGHEMHVDGMNSVIGRLGFALGHKTTDGNQVYLTASALHEFAGKRNVSMVGGGEVLQGEDDYRGTWYELGIGTNINLSKSSYFYGDIERGFGGDINKKWSVNGGVRFTF
ncbi:autotransporter outer membrane beta-barrel domain-containing protein [Phascolarctobacterium faecium]|uniref:autotransporter outer membrane beta-barrel domain-containing protein n=1 Tax=Phascolarctobacterium faecium TaxID=33025 RepID=UPI00265E3131|nr:autotransporter outer membrane beta-barrel domain-containing protein [Phascolarctobacterium faecium]